MARPAKTLPARSRRTFRARRDHGLLAGPPVCEKTLRKIQTTYEAAATDRERRSMALDFQEERVRIAANKITVGGRADPGPGGIAVADFFELYFIHTPETRTAAGRYSLAEQPNHGRDRLVSGSRANGRMGRGDRPLRRGPGS